MADAFPNSRFSGFDYHGRRSTPRASGPPRRASPDRTSFEVADAKEYPGSYDLICFFDCLHDMGDPVGVARHAREHRPKRHGPARRAVRARRPTTNIAGNPMAPLLYTASTAICTPNSLSQEVGLGLGAQAGEARCARCSKRPGFSRFRQAAETPLNLILEARA